MQHDAHTEWQHSHHFGQHRRRPGETRTVAVASITAAMMGVEIAAGLAFGSMALLADGLHMGSHALALGIAVFAYVYARRHAHDARFNFGTGKVNALGGFTGAILLAFFAAAMAWESAHRFFNPVPIAFNQAIFVAFVGLAVNALSVLILGHGDEPEDEEHHHHRHEHEHEHEHPHPHEHSHHAHHDHNLRSAYLHVLADALTSLFAIVALLTGKYLGWMWMDPLMGIVGAVMVALWSKGLLQATARVLLDMQVPENLRTAITSALESQDEQVTDLHVWTIGAGLYAAAICIVSPNPQPTEIYRDRLPKELGLVHVTVEVHKKAQS